MALSQRDKLIRIRRRTDSAGAPAAGVLEEGEPAYNDFGGTPASFYIGGVGAGAAAVEVVSANRQVERAGVQTITGQKTIALANLRITGGTDGDFIAVADNTTGELEFTTPTPPGILVTTPPFTGNGTSGSALNLSVAGNTELDAGTNNVLPVTSLGLRHLTGDLAALDTAATPLVPAINELAGQIATLQSGVTPVGTFNATTNLITPFSDSPAGTTPIPLPAPAAGNKGWLLYVTVAGTGGPSPPAPGAALATGDQLLSPGTGTVWDHIALGAAAVVASGVAIDTIAGPPAMTATTVQGALAELNTNKLATVAVDGTSITGTGVNTANALKVGEIDGGTY